ncbi:hypothetical protein R1sor_013062 [Riccia sorocarpa]|uniref:Uncharacterized protein n=1 Tax=Riccia sorocarpa TaxID=122646 RepID=A0ABD3H613_9MARC
MIICEFCPTDSRSCGEESVASQVLIEHETSESKLAALHQTSESKLAALQALGAVGFHIVDYLYEESKFRVQVIGAEDGLCVDLSSQEYFKFSQAMDSQLSEPEPEFLEEGGNPGLLRFKADIVTTCTVNGLYDEGACARELSPAETAKRAKKGRRYLKGFIPMLRFKERSGKENSHMQMRQRISMFMICLLRLFERKKKRGKAAASTAESPAYDDTNVEHSGLIPLRHLQRCPTS